MQPPTLTPTRTPTQTQTLTTGLLTAASMKTLRTASRTADGVFIDVIVTAGISNSRAAGADADMLGFDRAADGVSPGTINTIVVTNATLSAAALVEAHALAIESKCAACTELGLVCTKSGRPAQGTGTDATVVVSKCGGRRVRYAGKHTLFAELLGQATQEATHAALLACVDYMYGGPVRYTLRNWTLSAASSLQGARPCVPFSPSAPVPNAPASVICVGAAAVALSLVSPLPHSARVLLAAVAWDRCLGEPPLCVHPVMIVGNLISACVRAVPKLVYASPVLGLASGTALLLSLVAGSLASAWLILSAARAGAALATVNVAARLPGSTVAAAAADVATLGVILLEVLLLKSSLALQLLCTVALQMAKLLERRRIPHARDQLSWLCSRDPTDLGIEDLVGGTLESDPRHNLGPPTPPPGAICSPIPAASRSQVQCLLRALSGPSPRTCLTASSLPSFWYVAVSVRQSNSLGTLCHVSAPPARVLSHRPHIPTRQLGPLGALGYRVVNTLDSRVGYHGKYEWFGKPSARVDDLINLAPARLTALALTVAALVTPDCDAARGIRVAWRDCSFCESPNAGWPMGAMAGLLGVRLEKEGHYALGDATWPLGPRSIYTGHRIAQLAGGLVTLVAVATCTYLHRDSTLSLTTATDRHS